MATGSHSGICHLPVGPGQLHWQAQLEVERAAAGAISGATAGGADSEPRHDGGGGVGATVTAAAAFEPKPRRTI
jgi:hypothetical protein